MIGRVVSHYKILEKLGEGGMGVVYKAEDTRLHREVALKFLPSGASNEAAVNERFINEARAAATLHHPNICTVYEVDEVDGRPFIAMTYVHGKSLRDRIRREGALKSSEAVGIAVQVARGLHEAHRWGVVHRDIKPANIMISDAAEAIITDFGLAKVTGTSAITKTGVTLGTLAYMSPEQTGDSNVDARSDIWSLGVCLYEMLTGTLPFRGEYDRAVFYSILNEDPVPPSKVRSGTPLEIDKVVLRALAKNPADRYQSASDLAEALRGDSRGSRAITHVDATVIPASRNPSIAVLPFANMSADPEQEYFCDGIAEEIINDLSQLKDLRVAARTSAFAFKGKHEDIRDIGSKLNVATLLEGSVRKAGNRLRITAQLVKVSDGYHIWSGKYDREITDVFAIQDEISLAIVEKLKVTLLGGDKEGVGNRHAQNLEAYNLYLKGRYAVTMRTPDSIRKAADFFQRAIDAAPDYALAYAELASTQTKLERYGVIPASVALPAAKAASARAMQLDDALVEVQAAAGDVAFYCDWNWEQAETHFKRAIEINPNYPVTHHIYGWFLSAMRRHDESIRELHLARDLDPLSLIANANLGTVYYFARRHEEAAEQLVATVDMEPRFAVSHQWLGRVYEGMGRYDDAIREHEKALELLDDAESMASVAHACACSGSRRRARQLLKTLMELKSDDYVSSYWVGIVHLGLGEIDQALSCLEDALSQHFDWMTFINVEPMLEPLRKEPRFKALIAKIGL